jgi:hypothetical protein
VSATCLRTCYVWGQFSGVHGDMSLWSTSAKHRFIPAPVTGHSLIANVDLSLQEKIMKAGMSSP